MHYKKFQNPKKYFKFSIYFRHLHENYIEMEKVYLVVSISNFFNITGIFTFVFTVMVPYLVEMLLYLPYTRGFRAR